MALAIALLSSVCFAVAMVTARVGLRTVDARSGAALSIPTATALFVLAAPFALDTTGFDWRAVLFFAPAQIKKRSSEWGAKGLEERLLSAWQGFTARVTRADAPWLVTQAHQGSTAIETVYREALAGGGDPRVGHIIKF